jgi:malate dehydrogenase (oxaloacetate-decarboxylating)(NADP+)
MNMLVLPKRTLFIGDTYINYDPTAEQLAELTRLGAEEVRRFGLTPRAALLSHSNFGAEDTPTAIKMRRALEILREPRRTSKSMARCTATRRFRPRSGARSSPTRR